MFRALSDRLTNRRELYGFGDVHEKRDIMGIVDFMKLDVVEAKILTELTTLLRLLPYVRIGEAVKRSSPVRTGFLSVAWEKTTLNLFLTGAAQGGQGAAIQRLRVYRTKARPFYRRINQICNISCINKKMELPGPFSGTLKDVIKRMGIRNHRAS